MEQISHEPFILTASHSTCVFLVAVVENSTDQCLKVMENSTDQVSHCCDTVYLTGWNPYLVVSHCYNIDKQGVCPYSVMFSSNCYSRRTQQIHTDDYFMSFFQIMFYKTPLCRSSGFCELGVSSTLSTHACCVTSAVLTMRETQRQLQSENFIISNLKMNYHHIAKGRAVQFEHAMRSTSITFI